MIIADKVAQDRLLTTVEAAEVLAVSPQTAALWRRRKSADLPYIRVHGSIRYRREHIDRWLEAQTVRD